MLQKPLRKKQIWVFTILKLAGDNPGTLQLPFVPLIDLFQLIYINCIGLTLVLFFNLYDFMQNFLLNVRFSSLRTLIVLC